MQRMMEVCSISGVSNVKCQFFIFKKCFFNEIRQSKLSSCNFFLFAFLGDIRKLTVDYNKTVIFCPVKYNIVDAQIIFLIKSSFHFFHWIIAVWMLLRWE